MPLDVQDRLSWVKLAGDQVSALADLMRLPISAVIGPETDIRQEAALSLYLDRLAQLGDAIADLGDERQEFSDAMQMQCASGLSVAQES